tara:strand:- start:774 stop:1508 length:735 start_codon:yes stop_codon:yes gene_type:complete
MVSKKLLLVEEILKRSPNCDRSQLDRMTIHSLNTLLSTLNGVNIEPMKVIEELKSDKLTRKVRSKKRNVDNDNEDEVVDKDIVAEDIENEIAETETEIVENETEIVENEIVEKVITETVIVEKPKPKSKSKRGRPIKQRDIELDLQPTALVRSKKMSADKIHVKEILVDFKKEISKLIAQYNKIRNKTEKHRDKLIDIYNDLYDNTVIMVEKQIQTSYFPDESIYDYSEKMLINEKNRIQKLLQ